MRVAPDNPLLTTHNSTANPGPLKVTPWRLGTLTPCKNSSQFSLRLHRRPPVASKKARKESHCASNSLLVWLPITNYAAAAEIEIMAARYINM